MQKEILDRYERTGENEIILDIAAHKIEDLYEDFDKRSPFLKKDLDADLVEYMIDSTKEIGKENFLICFSLEKHCDEEAVKRVRNSVHNFFIYLKKLEYEKLKDMGRTSMILFLVGFFIAFLSIVLNDSELVKHSVAAAVVAEGLTVAAWVSLWEALATFLIQWRPHRRNIELYERIADAKILFNFEKALK